MHSQKVSETHALNPELEFFGRCLSKGEPMTENFFCQRILHRHLIAILISTLHRFNAEQNACKYLPASAEILQVHGAQRIVAAYLMSKV